MDAFGREYVLSEERTKDFLNESEAMPGPPDEGPGIVRLWSVIPGDTRVSPPVTLYLQSLLFLIFMRAIVLARINSSRLKPQQACHGFGTPVILALFYLNSPTQNVLGL